MTQTMVGTRPKGGGIETNSITLVIVLTTKIFRDAANWLEKVVLCHGMSLEGLFCDIFRRVRDGVPCRREACTLRDSKSILPYFLPQLGGCRPVNVRPSKSLEGDLLNALLIRMRCRFSPSCCVVNKD